MRLYYDEGDEKDQRPSARQRLTWLEDSGALALNHAGDYDEGFVFSLECTDMGYRRVISGRPELDDQAGDRNMLIRWDWVLEHCQRRALAVPCPRWQSLTSSEVRDALADSAWRPSFQGPWQLRSPACFAPLQGPFQNPDELKQALTAWRWLRDGELEWPLMILAALPKESLRLRVWLISGQATAWSLEHPLQPSQRPSRQELKLLAQVSERLCEFYSSKLVVFDFLRLSSGWVFCDAGPGSAALSCRAQVYRAVLSKLAGRMLVSPQGLGGGLL